MHKTFIYVQGVIWSVQLKPSSHWVYPFGIYNFFYSFAPLWTLEKNIKDIYLISRAYRHMIVLYTFNIGRVSTVYWLFPLRSYPGMWKGEITKCITKLKIICDEEPSISVMKLTVVVICLLLAFTIFVVTLYKWSVFLVFRREGISYCRYSRSPLWIHQVNYL